LLAGTPAPNSAPRAVASATGAPPPGLVGDLCQASATPRTGDVGSSRPCCCSCHICA
jgi:hypothetical protein